MRSVTFTTDWREDAMRRDFTMNALYCDADGTVHDPLGGYGDLEAKRVRFIGDARERIREDYLRILRFFRFVAAVRRRRRARCRRPRRRRAEKAGLKRLSGERIRAELLLLLAAPGRACRHCAVMRAAASSSRCIGVDGNVELVERLAAIEQALGACARSAAAARGSRRRHARRPTRAAAPVGRRGR